MGVRGQDGAVVLRFRAAGLVAVAATLAVMGCTPRRSTVSPLEALLVALPAGSVSTPGAEIVFVDHAAARADGITRTIATDLGFSLDEFDQLLTDGRYVASHGRTIPPGGVERSGYRVHAEAGLIVGHGLELQGPAPIEAALAWLTDTAKGATADDSLRRVVRLLGEPGQAVLIRTDPACGPEWVASAEKFPSRSDVGLWVWVVSYADPARATAEEQRLRRVAHESGARVVGTSVRGAAVVVQFLDLPPDPVSAACGN